ncbi:MAG: hypothetical protein M3Z13_05635 [Candidatus Dormibacteraeota bacterium]|nr:hypothetical protein [Candidatus Dormibacteraeota bacterium]
MTPSCPLCRAEHLTHWYHEDHLCWIADCAVCATPMVVWLQHGMPDAAEKAAMLERLSEVAGVEYPDGFWLDPEMRQIPDHFHCHARATGGFFGRSRNPR